MTSSIIRKTNIIVSIASLLGGGSALQAGDLEEPVAISTQEAVAENPWEFGFKPYLWMAGLEGTMGVNGVETPMDIDFGDIWDNLDFGWSSILEARRGKWGVMLDFTYLSLSDSFSPSFGAVPIAPEGFEMKMILLDLVGSYRAIGWDKGHLDFTGGVRWMSLDSTIHVATAVGGGLAMSVTDDWFDPHLGFRVHHGISEDFYLRGLADVGGFSVGSDLTVQLLAGVGYQVTDHVALELAYRYLKEDYDGSPSFSFDAEMQGPVLGLSIMW